jgi:hypothetical protein
MNPLIMIAGIFSFLVLGTLAMMFRWAKALRKIQLEANRKK